MSFNVYKWRRDQLLNESSIHPDPKDLTTNPEADLKKYRKDVLQQLLNDAEKDPDITPETINYLKGEISKLNEGEDKITVKSIKLSDLKADDKLPTNIGMGTFTKNPITTEEDLEEWREAFLERYGDIELIRGNLGYQASSKHPANVQAQADFDKYAKRG